VWVALRPEKMRIAAAPPNGAGENCVVGRVLDIGYLGNVSLYQVRLDDGAVLKAQVPNLTRHVERPIGWDDRVWLSWTPDAGVLLTK
jgi:putrescine transport system ATP-binding protein